MERHFSPFEYLPFGGGVRRCIGMAFAQFEMRIVLTTILAGFKLRRPPVNCPSQTKIIGPLSFRGHG
jgi:cytochrome P450